MITLTQLRIKALKYWEKQELFQAELRGGKLFPLSFKFGDFQAKKVLNDFSQIKEELLLLRKSVAEDDRGYTIVWKEVHTRFLGVQEIPETICFSSAEDLCSFIGKYSEWKKWINLVTSIQREQPLLKPWLEKFPLKTIELANDWNKLLAIIVYFQTYPYPRKYIRQLEISGVDSKYIENHKPLLRSLFDSCLPATTTTTTTTDEEEKFERRYELLYDEPTIRFRLLDKELIKFFHFSDLSIPAGQFIQTNISCSQVFITENKINGLSFQDIPDSIVIFGMGYSVNLLKDVEWLKEKKIFYWGDIDTHGFSILSRFRCFFPKTKSILMDEETLLEFKNLWVEEAEDKGFQGHLDFLTSEEQVLFKSLQNHSLGQRVRLEQERIPYDWVCSKIAKI
jgi:hypothetical protein